MRRELLTEKSQPTYDLEAFKAAFSSAERLAVTGMALRSAATLGFGRTGSRGFTLPARTFPEGGTAGPAFLNYHPVLRLS
jgi:hypothetical protein